MTNPAIDYSGIAVGADALEANDWDPPRKVFFGKKNEKGKMEKEPVYSYIEFPRMLYGKPKAGGPIVARIVNTTAEKEALLAKNWALTPADFGYIGAPSFDQHLKMTGSAAAEIEAAETEAVVLVNEKQAELDAAAKILADERAAFEAEKAEFEARKAASKPGRKPKEAVEE